MKDHGRFNGHDKHMELLGTRRMSFLTSNTTISGLAKGAKKESASFVGDSRSELCLPSLVKLQEY